MGNYNFIYGSKIIIQCQAQINIYPCRRQSEYNNYLILLKKNPDFFTNIDDKLVERTRVLTWSKTMGKTGHISGSGHGKQQITFKAPTFCARDMGMDFDPNKYSYSSS
jgi:hypothetical protein